MPMKRILYSFFIIAALTLSGIQSMAQADAGDKTLTAKETTISMYPMPTNGVLHITFNKAMSATPEVLVYDMIGNLQDNLSLEREASGSFLINLSGKKPGFYFIKVMSEDGSFSRRITVTP